MSVLPELAPIPAIDLSLASEEAYAAHRNLVAERKRQVVAAATSVGRATPIRWMYVEHRSSDPVPYAAYVEAHQAWMADVLAAAGFPSAELRLADAHIELSAGPLAITIPTTEHGYHLAVDEGVWQIGLGWLGLADALQRKRNLHEALVFVEQLPDVPKNERWDGHGLVIGSVLRLPEGEARLLVERGLAQAARPVYPVEGHRHTLDTPVDLHGLYADVAGRLGLSVSDAEGLVAAVSAGLQASLRAHEQVRVPQLGTFTVLHRKGRQGRDPQTGEVIHLPPAANARFRAGLSLKNALRAGSVPEIKTKTYESPMAGVSYRQLEAVGLAVSAQLVTGPGAALLPDIGRFDLVQVDARVGYHPSTGARIYLPGRTVVRMTPDFVPPAEPERPVP